MSKYKCGTCGKVHEGLPMDMSYPYPGDIIKIPSNERESRIEFNSESNPDVCIIDNSKYIIRGILELPVVDNERTFCWGVWAIIDKIDFERYLDSVISAEGDEEPRFKGKLSGEIGVYPQSDLLDIWVKLKSGNMRPLFFVATEDHPLGKDQKNGISMKRVHEFISELMPSILEEESSKSKNKPNWRQRIREWLTEKPDGTNDIRMTDVTKDQLKMCRKHSVLPDPLDPFTKLVISRSFSSREFPLNGLRHPAEGDTNGWYLWSGEELSTDPDFFVPLHVVHIDDRCPEIKKFLALPPGWRFLYAPDYEDVWFDESLLEI